MPKTYNAKKAIIEANRSVKFKIRKGDTVEVISGTYKGKRGEVISVDRALGRVTVKGVNLMKKTVQKSREHQKGGIIEREAPMHIAKVMIVSAKTGKATRIGRKIVDGAAKRFERSSGELIDK
ncbi:MAG: 50S ribosomal protein L24 [Spirochaetota bacterium]